MYWLILRLMNFTTIRLSLLVTNNYLLSLLGEALHPRTSVCIPMQTQYTWLRYQSPVIMVFRSWGPCLWSPASPLSPGCTVGTTQNTSFSSQLKSDESTKHYLTQMLLVIKFTHVYGGSRLSHASTIHWNPPSFLQKRKKERKKVLFCTIICIIFTSLCKNLVKLT